MTEYRLFDEGTIPDYTTPEWYAGREAAPHLEQEGQRDRLLMTANVIHGAIRRSALKRVVDIGAGDGGLLSLLTDPIGANVGFDLQQSNVDAAKVRGVNVILADCIRTHPVLNRSDVVVLAEVLEHMVNPHGYLDMITEDRANNIVASSPYTETDQAHYEFHTWAWDKAGYAKLFTDRGWEIIRHETAWISQIVHAARSPR